MEVLYPKLTSDPYNKNGNVLTLTQLRFKPYSLNKAFASDLADYVLGAVLRRNQQSLVVLRPKS